MSRTSKYGLSLVVLMAVAITASAAPQPNVAWPERSTAYLGVHIEAVGSPRAASLKLPDANGAIITAIDQDGPACHAGLKESDVIVGFNGSKVETPEQLGNMIHGTQPGKTVSLTIMRDGQKKDVSVALGTWPHVMANAVPAMPLPPVAFTAPAMAMPAVPDIEVPSFATLSSHHGVVVENLSPQLADFFGVPRGRGVLVRSVEKGSPAEAAGFKAGDVIVKVNNEIVHDMADWRRAMHSRTAKVPIVLVRDKREQTVVLNLPSPDSSRLNWEDWPEFEQSIRAWQDEMENIRPDLERQSEIIASAKPTQEQMEKWRHEFDKSMKLQKKDLEKMKKEIARSVPSQKDIEKIRKEALKSMPTQAEMDAMRRQIEESMQSWTPQFQHEMEQLQQEIEHQMRDFHMQGQDDGQEY